MKESEIRPEDLMKESEELFLEDVSKLLTHKNNFVTTKCPACDSSENHFLFEKEGFNFEICPICETVFINPRPTLEMLTEYYTTSKSLKYWNEKIFPATEDTRRNQIFTPRANLVVEICRNNDLETKCLVDVGAGFGTFCEEIDKSSVFDQIIAVEPSSYLAETCRSKGITVIEKLVEEVELDRVDVVTCFELIEHLFWPRDFLLACREILQNKGLLILTTPNIKGFDLLVLGKDSDNIRGPNHLNYFTPRSLIHLLESCGFNIINWLTPGKLDVEIVKNKVKNRKVEIPCPFLKSIIMDGDQEVHNSFQEFLVKNNLSSNLMIVAQKI